MIRDLKTQQPRNELEAELLAKEYHTRLMKIFIDDFLAHAKSNALVENQQFGEIILYMEANVADPNIVEHTARQFYKSPSTLFRLFKAQTGKSPGEYILAFRMQQALLLIKETSSSLTEIAYALGYTSYAGFFKQFKSYFNATPGSFRK